MLTLERLGGKGGGSSALWGRLEEVGERPAGTFDDTQQNEKKLSKMQIK
jgi:hypothetical protein